ncbi:MAG: hypothetical protein QOJ56_3150 [Mycobacterium sp.]|nr:hypothetical protein [Mycobacterium sp.]
MNLAPTRDAADYHFCTLKRRNAQHDYRGRRYRTVGKSLPQGRVGDGEQVRVLTRGSQRSPGRLVVEAVSTTGAGRHQIPAFDGCGFDRDGGAQTGGEQPVGDETAEGVTDEDRFGVGCGDEAGLLRTAVQHPGLRPGPGSQGRRRTGRTSTHSRHGPPTKDAHNTSKATLWSATNATRRHLHVGRIDTGISRSLDMVNSSPLFVAATVLDALERGQDEVHVDTATSTAKAAPIEPVIGQGLEHDEPQMSPTTAPKRGPLT